MPGTTLFTTDRIMPLWLKKKIACLTIVTLVSQPIIVGAEAIADPQAAEQHRPRVETTQNGTPIVQITAPSAAGVSRNIYTQFNVDPQGLILNNSQTVTQTQLAGYIIGNPNLANGTAKIILNEVSGHDPSNLRGYTEVAGSRAEVIIANPNGITGNGFGFINASQAVLTTGTPVFGGNGSLEAFRVNQGQITVEGNGMDAQQTDRADLISRAVQVNAGIWGKEVNVVTGVNKVDYNTLNAQKDSSDGNAPPVSLDVGQLGGMYANKITLVGTEQGVGVNSQGTISASGGNLVLTQEGKITNSGQLSAAGNIKINTQDSLTNQGTAYAQGSTNVNAANVDNSGVIAAAQNTTILAQTVSSTGVLGTGIQSDGTIGRSGDLTVTVTGSVIVKGQNLAGGNLAVTGTSIDLSGANTYAGNSATITATSGDIDHTGARLQAGGVLTISATGIFKNDKDANGVAGQIASDKVTVTAGDISNKGGSILQTGSDATTLTATNTIDNTGGIIATNGSGLTVNANVVKNNQGQVQHAGTGVLTVNIAGDLTNTGGSIAGNGQVTLQAQNIDNTQGAVIAQQQLDVNAASVTNDKGTLASSNAVTITATGAASNQQGIIQGNKGLTITAQSLNNQSGSILNLDSSDTTVTVDQVIQNKAGLIGGNGNVSVTAGNLANTQNGQIQAEANLTVATTQSTDNTNGTMTAGRDINLNQENTNLTNANGNISAGNTITLKTVALDNTSGNIAANTDVTITARSISGANSKMTAGQDVNITSSGDITYGTGSQIKAYRDVNVNATNTLLNQGSVTAVRNVNVIGGNVTNDTGANISATETTNVTATTNATNNGQINGSAISVTAGQPFTNTGAVMGGTLTVNADAISNNGATAVMATTGDTNLYARTFLENKDGANIYSMNNIIIAGSANKGATGQYTDRTGSVLNQSATIQAEKDITINANDITNKKREFEFVQQVVSDANYMDGYIRPPTPGDRWENAWLVWWRYTTVPEISSSDRGAIPSDWLIEEIITKPVITKDSPTGEITAGRNMFLRSTNLTNSMSNIMAGGNLDSVSTNFSNTDTNFLAGTDTKRILTVYDRQQYENQERDFANEHDVITYQPVTGHASIFDGGQTVSIQTVNLTNSSIAPGSAPAGTAQYLQATSQTRNVSQATPGNTANLTLPTNGMYHINTDPSTHYLVETDPRFANYGNFISSDYMLSQLGLKPDQTEKRLGDAFYEQKLVREQVTQLTGRTFLAGYGDSSEQYKALLANGAVYAKQFNLVVGIALTADQMAQLTSDMVWLVEKEVNGQKVLVPEVYLAQNHTGSLKADGALITGGNVRISASGDVNNGGVIKANDQALVSAVNITNNGGTIDGGKTTQLTANQDIVNISGLVTGDNVQLTAGRDIKNETYSYTDTQTGLIRTTTGNIATINAGQNLSLQSDRDISITGAKVAAGQDLAMNANRNLTVDTVQTEYRLAGGRNLVDTVNNTTSSIQAGGDVSMVVQQDANLRGAKVNAGNDLTLVAGGNVNISAAKDETIKDITLWNRDNFTRTRTDDETVIGSNLQAGGQVTVGAMNLSGASAASGSDNRGYVTIAGSNVTSQNSGVAIVADKDVTIQGETEKHESLFQTHTVKNGFLSSKTTDTLDSSLIHEVKGSTISGDTVTISAGTDLNVRGSNVVGTNDVNLTAVNDTNITSAKETGATEHYKYEKTSGLFSGGGFGITIGSKSEKTTLNEQTIDQIGSTVGSINGNVNVIVGNKVNSAGTTFVSGKDLNIAGKDVTIDNTVNTYDSQYKYEFKQSGLTVSLGGGVVDTAMSAYNNIERSGQVQDDRLKALYDYKAYRDIKDLSSDLKGGLTKANLTKDVGVNVSIGSSQSTSEQNVHTETANSSNITAGNNVNITAKTDDVTLADTKINAKNVTIDAARDINLAAAQNVEQTDSKSDSSSWSLGVSLNAGVFGNASKGSSNGNGTTITHSGTDITATDKVDLHSDRDINMIGSQVKGKEIIADVGRDLNIASQQDIDNYAEKSSSSGIGFSTGPVGGVTGSASKGKINSDYSSVTGQAGIYAGEGGFDIKVGKNTDLKGAVISSEATPDKNKLSTDTLTYSDIQNKAEYSASSVGVSVNTSKDAEKKDAGLTPNIGVKVSGDADSTTQSAISPGTIEIRSNPNQDISNLSRDPAGAVNALGKIFDKKTVQEKQELAQVFGKEAFKAIGDLADSQLRKAVQDAADAQGKDKAAYDDAVARIAQWNDGGANIILLHSIAGGLMADLGGGSFVSGAVGAGVNEAIQEKLSKITDPALHQWASAVIGAAASKVVGGDVQTGASTAVSGTKNNALDHDQQLRIAAHLTIALHDGDRESVKEYLKGWISVSRVMDQKGTPDNVERPTIIMLNGTAEMLGVEFNYDKGKSLTANLVSLNNTIILDEVMKEPFSEMLKPRIQYVLAEEGISPSDSNYGEQFKEKLYTMRDEFKLALAGATAEVGGSITGFKNLSTGFNTNEVPGRVQSRINLQNGDLKKGWEHVMDRHFNESKNASQFTVEPEELRVILQSEQVVKTPVSGRLESEDGVRYIREVNLDRQIGIDKFSGKPTSTMTVLTDEFGNLVTAMPGVLK